MKNVDKLSDVRRPSSAKTAAEDKDDEIIIDNDLVVVDDFDFDDPEPAKPAPAPTRRGSIDIDTDD